MATKQTFEQTARILRYQQDCISAAYNSGNLSPIAFDAALATLKETAREFARVYAQDNPRFDEVRFMTACGF